MRIISCVLVTKQAFYRLIGHTFNARPTITGEEIIELFNGMVDIANKARENEYDHLVNAYNDKDVIEALNDTKERYTYQVFISLYDERLRAQAG